MTNFLSGKHLLSHNKIENMLARLSKYRFLLCNPLKLFSRSSKSTIETLEEDVKYVLSNNKDSRMTSLFLCLIVNFKHISRILSRTNFFVISWKLIFENEVICRKWTRENKILKSRKQKIFRSNLFHTGNKGIMRA